MRLALSIFHQSLVSGFSDATLGGPRDDGKKTVVCFWGSSNADAPNAGSLSGNALREFDQAAQYNADDARLAFLAVNFDPAEKSDEAVRAEYGTKGATAPLFRLDRAALREFDFPAPDVPSLALLGVGNYTVVGVARFASSAKISAAFFL